MQLNILDRPFSLTTRALCLGLAGHLEGHSTNSRVIASHDPSRLAAFHSKNPHLHATYVWAVLDGFFMLSECYQREGFKKEYNFMQVFLVGDCGSLEDLRVASGRKDAKLLLEGERLTRLIQKLRGADPLTRLRYHIPPSLFYECWDYIKDPRDSFKRSGAKLFFAGNDGLRGIGAVFAALEAFDRLHESGLGPQVYAETVSEALARNMSLEQLAVLSLDYYNRLCEEVAIRLRSELTNQDEVARIHRNRCCKAILFKSLFRHFVLSWIISKDLAIVITSPRRNKSFYAHRNLNHHLMLDFGGLNGFEEIYPRTLDCMLYGKGIVSLNEISKNMFDCLCRDDLSRYQELSESIEPALMESIADA